jgi:O-antigen/teichoic acid export membrane protein
MLLALVGNIASARVLGPDDLGRFALVMAVITICGTLADLGMTYTAVKFIAQYVEERESTARRVARVYFVAKLLTGAVATLVVFLLAEPIALGVLNTPDLVPYLQLGAFTLIALGISSYPTTVLVGIGKFGWLGLAGVLNAAITLAGILLLLATNNLDLGGLVMWNVALPLVSTLPAWFFIPAGWLPWRWAKQAGYGDEKEAHTGLARRMFDFSKWILFSNLGSIIVTQGDLLLLGRLADPSAVGVYSVALALAMRLDVLNQSIFMVMMPRASQLSGQAEMKGYLRNVLRGTWRVAAVLGVAVILAQPVIGLLYGEEYAAVAPLFLALLVVVLFDLVTSPLLLVAFPLNKPRVLAITDWLRVVVLGVAGAILIPVYGGFGAAAARLLARVTGTGVALMVLRGEVDRTDEA